MTNYINNTHEDALDENVITFHDIFFTFENLSILSRPIPALSQKSYYENNKLDGIPPLISDPSQSHSTNKQNSSIQKNPRNFKAMLQFLYPLSLSTS